MPLVEIPENDPIEGGFGPPWTLSDHLCDENLSRFPWLVDRDADTWALVPWTWHGEAILIPFAGDVPDCTRASVEATYGPLVDVPHCLVCGSTFLNADGACDRRRDTLWHPVR